MPTALARRHVLRRSRRLEFALALVILIECIALSEGAARGLGVAVASPSITPNERAIAQALDAMLSP